jgi:predicted 2-oxoglutarate/Fe(II)-dependent dioxygenase YbiX
MSPLLIPEFLDARTCRLLRAAMDLGASEDAEIVGEQIERALDVRRVHTVDIDSAALADLEARVEAARGRIETHFDCALGEREGTSLLRYPTGGFYRRHRDRGSAPGWPAAARRRIALIAFLNGDFTGGELQLYPDDDKPIVVRPVTGLMAAFPATLSHEVLPVLSGTRDSVVDWFYDAI